MARRPRFELDDGIYHVTARGNRKQAIFGDDHDRAEFIALLGQVVASHRWRCASYCLMRNHFHLLIDGDREGLSNGMRYLNGVYAQRFNRRHQLTGHLFQDRFYAGLVESDWHLLELGRYIALNPVRAGICAIAAEWPWSSYNALTGAVPAPPCLSVDWLLSHFGCDRVQARTRYARFVHEAPEPA